MRPFVPVLRPLSEAVTPTNIETVGHSDGFARFSTLVSWNGDQTLETMCAQLPTIATEQHRNLFDKDISINLTGNSGLPKLAGWCSGDDEGAGSRTRVALKNFMWSPILGKTLVPAAVCAYSHSTRSGLFANSAKLEFDYPGDWAVAEGGEREGARKEHNFSGKTQF